MGKKLDKVSVITTFYNAEKFVLDAINSVNQQIISGFELEYVLVDDKSTDNTRKLVEEFIDKHVTNKTAWRIIEPEENLGCGGARKFGIDNATGDYFMFLDADDYYIKKDFILRAYNEIKKEKADIVEFGMIMNHLNGQQVNNSAPQRFVIENNPMGAEIALFKDNLIKFNVWCKIYTRAIVESYPYSTTRTYEDVRTIPARIPPIHRNGKYQSTWMLFRTSIATRICPMLWKIPPATLTKRRLKLVYFFRTNMAIKLSIPPAAEYISAAMLPKVKLTSRILTILRAKASKALNRYKAIRTTRLVSPNLMPGIGKKYGICISTQESTKASAMSNPLSAIFFE